MSDSKFQTSFAKAVQSQASVQDRDLLISRLDPRYQHRLQAYSQSYYGRVISVLASTVMAQLQVVLGAEAVRQLLSAYFTGRTVSDVMISDTLKEFPNFIEQKGDGSLLCQLTKSLAELCMEYWQVAKGPNPPQKKELITDGIHRTLVKTSSLVIAPAQINLFAAWTKQERPEDSENSIGFVEENYPKKSVSVLVIKTSPRKIVSVPVYPSFLTVAKELCFGKTLQTAVNSLSSSELSQLGREEWIQFIHTLNRENCWAEDLT